ncbi:hypothetical protein MHUMG1_08432 [Metarhizium humberi]|uniref:Uncharacterized protein n=1 Tax=Metarhizium humberi TaxID=2596975 RepID=A0A9P8M538_9HYPO|nr:hypothetical protein MHUMG1_08432 [Metarhizium humberi]
MLAPRTGKVQGPKGPNGLKVCHDDGPNNLQGCTVSAGHESAPNTYCRDTYRLGTSDNNADAEGQLFRLQIHWVSTAPIAPNSPLEQSRALERQLAVGHEAGGVLQGGDDTDEGDKGNVEQEDQLVLTPRSSHGQADQGQESREDMLGKVLERGRTAKTSGTPPLPKCAADPRLIPPVHD